MLYSYHFFVIDRREINRNLAAQLKTKLNFDQETSHMNNQSIEKNEQIDSSLTSNNHHGKCLLLSFFFFVCVRVFSRQRKENLKSKH